jgi:hypothetical protein
MPTTGYGWENRESRPKKKASEGCKINAKLETTAAVALALPLIGKRSKTVIKY